jgi:tetratricopeptide (TPR) repeat protein
MDLIVQLSHAATVFRSLKLVMLLISALFSVFSPSGVHAQVAEITSDSAFAVYMDSANAHLKRARYYDRLQRKYADDFYAYYQRNPDSEIAKEALKDAIIFWVNLSDKEQLYEALESLPVDSGIWEDIIQTLYFSSAVDLSRNERFIPLLETLIEKSTDPGSRSAMMYLLAGHYRLKERMEEAMDLYRQVAAQDKDDFYRKNARKIVDDYQKTGVGRQVPELTGINKDGEKISLKDHRGKIVILDFWTDEWQFAEESHRALKDIRDTYPREELVIIGVILSDEEDRVARIQLNFDGGWTQLRIPEEEYEQVREQFSIQGPFKRLIIDQQGVIAAGRLSVDTLEEKLKELSGLN